jgi:hypothetical protein
MRLEIRGLLLIGIGCLFLAGCGRSAPSKPLHAAVQETNYPAVRNHIEAHSNLNAKDKTGWTALHLAVMKGDLLMVQLLAGAGADPKVVGLGGKTPIDVAREKRQTSIVQYLEGRLAAVPETAVPEKRGRGLIDGGLGVSDVLDSQ